MYCFSGVVIVGGDSVNFYCVLHLDHFLKNYKGYRHETWVMHTSGSVKLKATINNVS